jgi:hypothetical protein
MTRRASGARVQTVFTLLALSSLSFPNHPSRRMADHASVASNICGDLATMHEPGYGTTGMFRTCYIDDLVVVADDIQLTDYERQLLARGRGDCIRANRVAFQYVTGPLFVAMVERATGRRVLAFSGEVHLEPLFEVAVFRLAPEPGPLVR